MSRKKKSKRVFAFTTPLPPADFKQKLREAVHNDGSLLYEDTQNGFDLGIERGGHSGGYWYTATLTETEDGTEMRGEIVYRSYHKNGEYREDTKWEKIREWLGIVLIVIFFSPVFLIALATRGIMLLVGKLRGRPVEVTMSTEEKLTRFMTEVMGCREEE
jgi:hypothetical protein